jgi:hypothetical protein
MASLRAWLRRQPQPFSLLIRTEDGEERTIKLGDGRDKWKVAEQAIATSRAVSVQCLDAEGKLLRGEQLREEAAAAGDDGGADYDEKRAARTMLAQASMLDRYGARLNEAYKAGAEAANTGHDQLVALVEVLTLNLTSAITSLHNVSMNFANVIARAGGGEDTQHDQNGAMLTQLLAGMASRAMMPPAPPPNGKTEKK